MSWNHVPVDSNAFIRAQFLASQDDRNHRYNHQDGALEHATAHLDHVTYHSITPQAPGVDVGAMSGNQGGLFNSAPRMEMTTPADNTSSTLIWNATVAMHQNLDWNPPSQDPQRSLLEEREPGQGNGLASDSFHKKKKKAYKAPAGAVITEKSCLRCRVRKGELFGLERPGQVFLTRASPQ